MAYNARIQHKRDTAANWEANNPVLLDGEIVIVITNAGETRYKIGDGNKHFSQLPFQDEPLMALINDRVQKVDGMGLSSNDYTTEEKVKLAGIEDNANNYTLPIASSDTVGGIKSGTNITVDASGNVSVSNDSHTHSDATITSLDASKLTGTIPSSMLPSYDANISSILISRIDEICAQKILTKDEVIL